MYRITGFCAAQMKPHGDGGIVWFKVEDQFDCEVLPTREELLKYIDAKGYKIEDQKGSFGRINMSRAHVNPIYIENNK